MEKNVLLPLRKLFFINLIIFLSLFFDIKPALAGTILVSDVLTNSVTLFDEITLQPIKKIKVGFMPHEVVVTPNGKFALVSNFGDLLSVIPGNSVTVIDIANAKVLQTILLPAKSRPHGLALLSDSEALVTTQGIQSLLLIDLVTGVVKNTLPLPGAGAHMVLIDEEKRFAYVANVDSGSVCKIDLRNFSVVGEIKIGKEAEGLALTQGEDLLLVTDRTDNYVAVVRTKDLSVQKTISTGSGPVRVSLFADGKSAVVTNSVSGTAQTIDIASLSIQNTFKTSPSINPLPVPINIYINDNQTTAYVTNSFACEVALIDLIQGKIIKTFKGGYMPDGIAISQITEKALTR